MKPVSMSVGRLTAPTVYKIIFLGGAFTIIPFGTLMGLLSYFGFDTVKVNGTYIHGFSGLATGSALGPPFVVVLTLLMGSVTAVGLWLYAAFRPIQIAFFPLEDEARSEGAGEASANPIA